MHQHRVAHLDISLRNLLTDYNGHYCYIDFELSRRFDGVGSIRIPSFRTTEVPPECERSGGDCPDPFKADVWALVIAFCRVSAGSYHSPGCTHIAGMQGQCSRFNLLTLVDFSV
jgi:serine/threonine protein kinase